MAGAVVAPSALIERTIGSKLGRERVRAVETRMYVTTRCIFVRSISRKQTANEHMVFDQAALRGQRETILASPITTLFDVAVVRDCEFASNPVIAHA